MEFVLIVIGAIGSIISGLVILSVKRYLKQKDQAIEARNKVIKEYKEELEKINNELEEIRKDSWRLRKTILIIAKILDDQLDKKHPELTANLEDIATELLKQSDNS